MRIGIIIPDRGDRPRLMDNCIRMMAKQTLIPDVVLRIDFPPHNSECDITKRYRIGYEALSKQNLDLIALIENDDAYSPDYLETMVKAWEENGKPDIFGTNYTIYYHLKLRKYFTFDHFDRASAMNTFLKPALNIAWPVDHDPYTDLHLWRQLKGIAIKPSKIISIGIKHGEGKTGGQFHTDELDRFTEPDNGLLKNNLDSESFEFYDNYFNLIKA